MLLRKVYKDSEVCKEGRKNMFLCLQIKLIYVEDFNKGIQYLIIYDKQSFIYE